MLTVHPLCAKHQIGERQFEQGYNILHDPALHSGGSFDRVDEFYGLGIHIFGYWYDVISAPSQPYPASRDSKGRVYKQQHIILERTMPCQFYATQDWTSAKELSISCPRNPVCCAAA